MSFWSVKSILLTLGKGHCSDISAYSAMWVGEIADLKKSNPIGYCDGLNMKRVHIFEHWFFLNSPFQCSGFSISVHWDSTLVGIGQITHWY